MVTIHGPKKLTRSKNELANILPKNRNIGLLGALKGYLSNQRNYRNYEMLNNRGNLVGFAMTIPDENTLEIGLLATKMGHKYGPQLMNRIKNNARRNGFKKINLYSVERAKPFYGRQGFTGPYLQLSFNLTK